MCPGAVLPDMEALPPGDDDRDDVGVDADYEHVRSLRRAYEDRGDSPHRPIEDSDVGQTEFEPDDVEDIGDADVPAMPRACDLGYPEACDPNVDESDALYLWDEPQHGDVALAFVKAEDDAYVEDVRNCR